MVPRLKAASAPIVVLVLVSLFLNTWGIKWGLSSEWHPDEVLIRRGLSTMADQRSPDPQFYAYGLFHFYELMAFAEVPSRLIRKVDVSARAGSEAELDRRHEARTIILGRILSAILGTGVVLLGLAYGTLLFDKRTGRIAGWLLALSAGLVVYSHFLTVDVSSMFWFSAAALLSGLVFATGQRKWYLLAALAIGVAASVKYVGILAVIPLVVAHFLRTERKQSNLLLGLGATVAAGILASPLILLSPFRFLDGVTKELFFNTGRVWAPFGDQEVHYSGSSPVLRFLWYVKDALGWPLFVGALAAVLYSVVLVRHSKFRNPVLLTWSGLIPYFLVMGSHQVSLLWYTLPLLMFLAILTAKLLSDLWESPRTGVIGRGLLGVVVAYSLLYCVAADLQFLHDSRAAAGEWIVAHVPEGSRIETTGGLGPRLPENRYSVSGVKTSSDQYHWIELGVKHRDQNAVYLTVRRWSGALENAAKRTGLVGARDPYVAWYESPAALANYREASTTVWTLEELNRRNPEVLVLTGIDPHTMRFSKDLGYYQALFSGKSSYRIARTFKFMPLPWLHPELPHVNPTVTIFTKQPGQPS